MVGMETHRKYSLPQVSQPTGRVRILGDNRGKDYRRYVEKLVLATVRKGKTMRENVSKSFVFFKWGGGIHRKKTVRSQGGAEQEPRKKVDWPRELRKTFL